MPTEIVSDQARTDSSQLADRLDATIGETSSGIGAMLSELVRRSLRSGVSEIGDSLHDFAEEKVGIAVERQMPEIAEAANAVAESASQRVVSEAIGDIESKIEVAEGNAVDRSKHHVEEIVGTVRESLDQTRNMTIERSDASERKIEELRDKARGTWRKLMKEFEEVNQTNEKLRKELGAVKQQFQQQLEQQSSESGKRYAELVKQNELLAQRLVTLEQPRGIKALFAKIGGKKKKATEANIEQSDTGTETDTAQES